MRQADDPARRRIVLDAAADEVRGAATSGPAIAMAEFPAGCTVWDRRRIAGQESAVVAGPLDEADRCPVAGTAPNVVGMRSEPTQARADV